MSAETTADKPASPPAGMTGKGPSSGYHSGPGKGRMGGTGPGGARRPMMRRKICRICHDRNGHVDWKAVNFLRNFITDRGKILAGRMTGTCATCQRKLTTAIKRAQNMALLPTSPNSVSV